MGFDHILLTIRCLLINPNPESALNEEAGKLLLEDYTEFAARAKLMTSIYAKPKENKENTLGIAPKELPQSSNASIKPKKKKNLKRL